MTFQYSTTDFPHCIYIYAIFLHLLDPKLSNQHYHFTSAFPCLCGLDGSSPTQLLPLLPMSSLVYLFHLNHLALLHPSVITCMHYMSIPTQSSFLHTTYNSSYTQFFSQLICASSFMHINITHPTDHTCFISYQPLHILCIQCPSFTTMQHGTSYTCIIQSTLLSKREPLHRQQR